MVILSTLSNSYITNGNGERSEIALTSPGNENRYSSNAEPAIVGDQFFIFGGEKGHRKIARLDNCAFVELSVKLNKDFPCCHGVLAIENGSKALICFPNVPPSSHCDEFDGTRIVPTKSSIYAHNGGGLAYYNNQPTTVAGYSRTERRKVETLGEAGWQTLTDLPVWNGGHALVGLSDGDLLVLGGMRITETSNNFEYRATDEIYRLRSGTWTLIGNLLQPSSGGKPIFVGSSIYIFGPTENASQKLILDENNTIKRMEFIGSPMISIAAVLITEKNTCAGT